MSIKKQFHLPNLYQMLLYVLQDSFCLQFLLDLSINVVTATFKCKINGAINCLHPPPSVAPPSPHYKKKIQFPPPKYNHKITAKESITRHDYACVRLLLRHMLPLYHFFHCWAYECSKSSNIIDMFQSYFWKSVFDVWQHWGLSPLTFVTVDVYRHWRYAALTIVSNDVCHRWCLSPLTFVTFEVCHHWRLLIQTMFLIRAQSFFISLNKSW